MSKITPIRFKPWFKSFIKTMLLMKLSWLLIMISCLQVSARTYSQEKFTLSFNGVKLEKALKEIEKKSDFRFVYSNKFISKQSKISLSVKDATLDDVLDLMLKNTGLTYIFPDAGKLVVISNADENIKPVLIKGRVVDMDGNSMKGVSVHVKGNAAIGTTTDENGNFQLPVPDNATTLIFSYVGYAGREVSIVNRETLSIVLQAETKGLNDVVVVGYGTQKKVNLTGAISTVKFDDELNNRPITNATQALSGKASGVWVSQNSGQPGSDGAQLRVRGWGTLNNADPFVIIDGVEGSFNQINPSDIESISVLKDAASAAIYGSKAANGVILITTKMGRKNEKMQVNLNSYIGTQSLAGGFNFIDNSAEYMKLYNKALSNGGSSPLFPDYLISAFENGKDPYKYPNTNWNDALFRNAIIQENNVSIRGGSAQSSSFLSFNYLNQAGIVPGTKSERYGIRANVESNVKDWLKVTGRLNYSRKVSEEPYADVTYGSLGRVFYMLDGATPFIAPYTRDGRFGSVQAIDSSGNLLYDNRNPLIDAANGSTRTEVNSIVVNASVEIKFTNNLKLNTTFASTSNWNLVDKYNQSIFGYTDNGIQTITKNYNREGLEMNRSNVSFIDNNLYTTLNYHKIFAQKHDFSAIAGMQLENTVIKNVYARSTGAPQVGLTQVDAGTSGIQGQGNMVGLKMFSYFGRINYSLSDKYLFEADLRADASSRFKKGNRWGIFPGFSAGWRLSEEKFIQNLNLFSNLKFRGSWGQLGNQNISGYWPYLTVINQNFNLSYSSNGSFVPGAAVTSLVDENITWETTSTLDLGLDMGFLNNKIIIEADYFNKKTSGIIVRLPIPGIMGGVTPPYENVGQMLNNGFELALNYDNRKLRRDQLSYNIGVNGTYIKNEVTKFRGGKSPDQLFLIREGYSYQALYGYKAIGIFQTDEEAKQYMSANSYKPKAGNLKFEDVNHDGKLDYQDKQGLGNTIPKFTFGLTSGFKYKGFDLNILFQGIAGVHAYTQNEVTNNITTDVPSITTKWRNAWTPQNTNTDIPSIKLDNTWDNSESSFWVKEISFVKLRNIQLGYEFLTSISSRLGFKKLYVYVNAQNVFTIVNKNFEGYDPEKNTFSSSALVYPNPRIISFGINIKF